MCCQGHFSVCGGRIITDRNSSCGKVMFGKVICVSVHRVGLGGMPDPKSLTVRGGISRGGRYIRDWAGYTRGWEAGGVGISEGAYHRGTGIPQGGDMYVYPPTHIGPLLLTPSGNPHNTYGWQSGSTHFTGMLSYSSNCSFFHVKNRLLSTEQLLTVQHNERIQNLPNLPNISLQHSPKPKKVVQNSP